MNRNLCQLLKMMVLMMIVVPIVQAGQSELIKELEDDYGYYQRIVVPTGKQGKINFLKKLIIKYEKKSLDDMYIDPIKEELKSIQEEKPAQLKEKIYEEKIVPTYRNKEREFTPSPAYNLELAETIFKIGFEANGKHKTDGQYMIDYFSYTATTAEDVNDGVSLSVEQVIYANNNYGLGGGIAYQIERELKDYEGKFNFIPIYGLAKLRTVPRDIYQPSFYLTGQLGYNILEGDRDYKGKDGVLDGGLYYGIGGGLSFKNGFLFELLYSVNNGSYEAQGVGYDGYGYFFPYKINVDIEYSLIRLSIGYSFFWNIN